MATITAIDYRRTDLRNHVWTNPYWITSGAVSAVDSDDKGAILFSFPKVKSYFIDKVVVQITTALTASTTIDVGYGTLATDAVTTGGDITIVDADEYFKTADLSAVTAGYYGPTTANTSDWLTAKIAGTWAAPYVFTGAATNVPCIYASVTNAGVISAGIFRVHVMITEIPGGAV